MKELILAYLIQQIRQIKRLIRHASHINKPKRLHKTRIAIKKLRAYLSFFIASCNGFDLDETERKMIRKLFKKMGRVRSVYIHSLQYADFESPDYALKQYVTKVERRQKQKLVKEISKLKKETLKSLKNRISAQMDVFSEEDLSNALKVYLEKCLKSLQELSLDLRQDKDYHQYRKVLKEILYLLEPLTQEQRKFYIHPEILEKALILEQKLGMSNDNYEFSLFLDALIEEDFSADCTEKYKGLKKQIMYSQRALKNKLKPEAINLLGNGVVM